MEISSTPQRRASASSSVLWGMEAEGVAAVFGMVARIAFAIATITKPDVLIADEILSVGDFMFQEKCEERMRQLMSGGTTVLLVSHSIGQIERMCDHVTWLEKGRVKMQGEAAEVCAAYKALDPEAAAIQNANSNKRIIEAP